MSIVETKYLKFHEIKIKLYVEEISLQLYVDNHK